MTLRPLYGHLDARSTLAHAAAEGRLPQVLLFSGPVGIGKQRLALWLAQRLVCASPAAVEPCGTCRGCRQVLELAHPDVHWFVPVPRPKAAESDKQADEVAELLGELHAERRVGGRWGAPDGMSLHGMGSVRLLQRRASLTASAGGARIDRFDIPFAGGSPFSHSALDMKTFAMALLKCDYRDATKRNMPRRWFGSRPHTHVALDDAIEQGELFCAMLAELHGRGPTR